MDNIAKKINFTDAKKEDLAFIVDVYNQTIASKMVTADICPITVESRLDWFNAHNPKTRPLWLIKLDEFPCGWVSLSTFYARAAYDKTVEISLYIDTQFRGQKIGQYAVMQLEHFVKQNGIETIVSYIFAHNQPSLSLFEKLGYQQWGYLPQVAELDKIKRDLVIMGKSLI